MTKQELKLWLSEIFEWKRILNLENNRYVINPLTDHEPYTTCEMLETAIQTYHIIGDFTQATKLIWEEDRWGFLTALMSYNTGLPFGLVKWNPIDYEGQMSIDFRNAYTSGKMYLNGVSKWDKVIIIEDLIDTGGTVIGLIELLQQSEIEVIQVLALAAKYENHGVQRIYEKTGIQVKVGCYFSLEWETSKITSFTF